MGPTTEFVTSRDGTRIGFDRQGEGPAVILVAGAMQFRAFDPTTVALATNLAAQGFTVINFDRRGRGDSAATESFTLDDTIDDLRALIDAAGGEAALFGNSSGGSISLAAAARGLSISHLVLFEVPLGPELGDDGASFLDGLRERVAAGDREGTVEYFMKDMPPEWLEGARQSPGWPTMVAMAPSLEPDAESLAWTQSALRPELWSAVTQPTLVLIGESTQPIMQDAAESIVSSLANARFDTIEAAGHGWAPDRMASAIGHFLAER